MSNLEDTDGWTKREMKLWADPIEGLIRSIIWQWKQDGEPLGDKASVHAWAKLLIDLKQPGGYKVLPEVTYEHYD